MHRHLPIRSTAALAATVAGLALAATAAPAPAATPTRAATPVHRVPLAALVAGRGGDFQTAQERFRWALSANPGIIDGALKPEQVLLKATGRHRCRSLHVNFVAGGQAQSASLVLRRAGRPDLAVGTQTDTAGALDARLDRGRSWQLAGATPGISIALYANGWLECAGAKDVARGAGAQ